MKQNLLVFDADYTLEENKGIVRLFCKDEKGKTVLIFDSTFEPYFYVLPKKGNLEKLKKKIADYDFKNIDKIKKVEVVEKDFYEKKLGLLKIVLENPRKISDVRDVIKEWDEVEEEYEYTIPFPYRYLLDKKIEPMSWVEIEGEVIKSGYKVDTVVRVKDIKPIKLEKNVDLKVLAFDLELVEENNEEKIIMISLADNKNFKRVLTIYEWEKAPDYVEIVKDEKEMIERFLEIVRERDPDIICGYNSDSFDFLKLRERCMKLKIGLKLGRDDETVKFTRRGRISSARMKGRVHVDLYDFVLHILSPSMMTEVLTLDAVAQELLGIGKIGIKWKEIEESWRMKKDVERIAEYALRDAELTLKLSEHLLPQIFSLSRLTGLLPFDVTRYTYSQLVESFLMRKAIETNVLLPNHPKSDEIERRRMRPVYKGALVVEPKKGIHSDILVFDFASLYPTIICTHNISPETLNCEHEECKKNNKVPELNYHFCQKRKGFIPTHLEELIKKRREIKDEMKKVEKDSLRFRELSNLNQAIKTIANAMYGYFSFFSARWYSVECGAASASFGRYYITKVLEMAKECFEIIYSDTDSAMLRMKSCDASTKREELIKKAGEFVEKVNEELPGMIELEFRGLYEGGIFIARRGEEKGAKKRYALIDYEGNLEVRGFEVRRGDWCQLAKKTQEEVLRAIMRDKSPEKAIRIVRDSIKKIRDGKASIDELVIYTQLVKPLSAYEQIGPHVKAAMKMRDKGRPIGEGMIVAYVITKGTGSISDRAFPVEDVKEGDYDPDYYVNNQVLPAAMRVLQALEITEEQVLSGRIQASLGEWFKR